MRATLIPLRRITGAVAELRDEALVAACATGETAALGALYDRHHAAVYRFLGRLATTDTRDLDDMVQSTFMEVQRGAARYSGTAAVRSWIFGVAANIARHHARGEGRRRALLTRLEREATPHERWPEAAAARRQLLSRIADALAALPHDLRVAFVMCELEETPGVEAARVLGVREGTLWRRLHEARRALRAAIEKESK